MRSASGEHKWGRVKWLATAEIGNSRELSLARMILYPGRSNDRHRHPNSEEAIYLVQGRVRHDVGGEPIDQQVGEAVIVPRGVPHRSTNVGEEAADLVLAYSSPARIFVPE